MAKLRAPAIAIMIQNICLELGQPFEPKTAPNMANGNAKTVCSNLIILRIIWNLEKILIMDNLRDYCNKELIKISVTYNHKVMFINDLWSIESKKYNYRL